MTPSTPNESDASAQTSASADAEPASSGTTADTADAATDADQAAGSDAAPKVAFGGLTPSEAARKRWDRKRAQDEAEDQARADDARKEVALVRVTVEIGAVIDKLAREAKGGNVQAARELREWLSKVEAETDTSVSALDRATRQRMKARLLAEMAEAPMPIAPTAEGHNAEDPSPQRPYAPSASAPTHDGAVGQAGRPSDEAHPADAGTPVDA